MEQPDRAAAVSVEPLRRIRLSRRLLRDGRRAEVGLGGPQQEPVRRPGRRARTFVLVALGLLALLITLRSLGDDGAVFLLMLATILSALRAVGPGLHGTFADGFLGYRAEDGWPHGVQEEYDVKWGFGPAGRARA